MKYQVNYMVHGEWHASASYNELSMAKWYCDNVIVNPMACVVDITTGEVVYGL